MVVSGASVLRAVHPRLLMLVILNLHCTYVISSLQHGSVQYSRCNHLHCIKVKQTLGIISVKWMVGKENDTRLICFHLFVQFIATA